MNKNHKPAFSMLELVFVITILGIVSSIGSQIIVQVYESYITQRSMHRSSIKTELAVSQITNRLAYSIPGTVIGRQDAATFEAIEDIPIGTTNHDILEWISYDADSFSAVTGNNNAGKRPVWSGYCDVAASSINQINTPGSRLRELDNIIQRLRPNGSTTTIANGAVLFPTDGNIAHQVGYQGSGGNIDAIHPVAGRTGDNLLNLINKGTRTIKEHYKFAWTAYAIEAVPLNAATLTNRGFPAGSVIFDLIFHYDYQPWEGESYPNNGSSAVLIRNVSVFKFTGIGDTIRLKICQREIIGGTVSTTTCKEKAVIR